MNKRKIKIAITHGDINSVAYEVILKTLEDNRLLELCTPIIYGSAKIAAQYRRLLELPNIPMAQIGSAAEARDGVISVINVVGEDVKATPGENTPEAGASARAALEAAVADLKAGNVDALVTAPINKNNIQSPEFTFAGHTEYLQASLGDDGQQALMVLCTETIRVALVTTHLPLAGVAAAISRETILEHLRVFDRSLRRDFGIDFPRIAVLALNPHAGDGGVLGSEETEIIAPAIDDARAARIMAFGPYSADGFFGAAAYRNFDGVLAMYHDQGLAPFKTLAMDSGVNFTAGLDYVRTSPDHGTGYDIAGKNLASPDSMRAAIYAAIDIVRSRRREDAAAAHPLKRQYYEKGPDNVVLDLSKDDL